MATVKVDLSFMPVNMDFSRISSALQHDSFERLLYSQNKDSNAVLARAHRFSGNRFRMTRAFPPETMCPSA